MSWIGTDVKRRWMDPEERLWFLERAVEVYLSAGSRDEYLVFADPNDGHQYVRLLRSARGVRVEVGSREWFVCRPLTDQAVARLRDLGFEHEPKWSAFVCDGLPSSAIFVSKLIERLFIDAYDVAPDYALRASFRTEASARRLERMLRLGGS